MAVPTILANRPPNQSSTTTDISPGIPTGNSVNDIYLCIVESAGDVSIPTPTGGSLTWAPVDNSPQIATGVGTATRLDVFWARGANASETGPAVSVNSGNHAQCRIIGINGCRLVGNPWDVTAGSADTTEDTSVSIPGFTTTVNDCLILDICSHGFDVAGGQFSGLTNASVDGGTVTEELDYGVTAGNGGGVLIASSTKATAGSVSATTATLAVSAATAQIKIALTSIEAGANPAIFFYNRLMSA